MSFDAAPNKPLRIAVIGGGISGMAAAYLLAPNHLVTLFEGAPRLGGHARTVIAGRNGDQPVDTGFIAFNYANYPHLTRLFNELDVPVQRCDMSFGATINDGQVEYGLKDLGALLGQRRNLTRPGFFRMLRDIARFNARAEAVATTDDMTVNDLVGQLGLGDWFQRYYLHPVCGAIWSCPSKEVGHFSASALLRFMRNHALLSATGQHQWWTVKGGSIEYVRRLEVRLKSRGVAIRKSTPIKKVTRTGFESEVHTGDAPPQRFDHVVFATHSDDALRLIDQPSRQEAQILGRLTYRDNHAILHSDARQMPRRRACWSSWVYRADDGFEHTPVGVTYWMNRLQSIPDNDPLFVTLNPQDPVDERLIYDQVTFRHPVFDVDALKAQRDLAGIQGTANTWFAGAYLRNGFHEDGFASALRVARRIGQNVL